MLHPRPVMIATVCRVTGAPSQRQGKSRGLEVNNPERAQCAVAAGAALAAHGVLQDSETRMVAADPVPVFSRPPRVERGL